MLLLSTLDGFRTLLGNLSAVIAAQHSNALINWAEQTAKLSSSNAAFLGSGANPGELAGVDAVLTEAGISALHCGTWTPVNQSSWL